jgi:hypothetical protein
MARTGTQRRIIAEGVPFLTFERSSLRSQALALAPGSPSAARKASGERLADFQTIA